MALPRKIRRRFSRASTGPHPRSTAYPQARNRNSTLVSGDPSGQWNHRMQLLIAKTAYDRLKSRIDAIAPGLDVVTVVNAETLQRNGATIAPEAANPDLAWLGYDTLQQGLMPVFFTRLLQANNPKWLQIMFAGLDNPVFKQIMAKGIRLTKSSAQAIPIAEHVIAHAFALILPLDSQRDAPAKKEWRRTAFREIGHTRWTLIGFGSIGKEIAKRVKPFGTHLTVVR